MKAKSLSIALLSVLVLSTTHAQNGNLSNGGFESWNNTIAFENPNAWTTSNEQFWSFGSTASRSSDAQHGTSALQLNAFTFGPNSDTASAYCYQGFFGQSGPENGAPYTQNCDAIRFMYKPSLMSNDTLYLLVVKLQSGTVVSFDYVPVSGSNSGTWQSITVPISNASQDELLIGFTLGNLVNDEVSLPGSSAIIDKIEIMNAGNVNSTSYPNASFETWDEISIEDPTDWYTVNSNFVGFGFSNVTQSTDAHSGNFAASVKTDVTVHSETVIGILSLGMLDFSSSFMFGAVPYDAITDLFTGYYKYTAVNGDTASANIIFYDNGMVVESVSLDLQPASSYTLFLMPIHLTAAPDSVTLFFLSGSEAGSTLLLDDLNFEGGNVSIDAATTTDISLSPNPCNETFSITGEDIHSIQIFDCLGASVFSSKNQDIQKSINVSHLPKGIYLVSITSGHGKNTQKLIINR